ncbi:YitT family protein [Shouchella sp. 1P09AA]|uniref:YitT family protein n=1 Tax=unclassified Shouchella TaxID=2893065 RepID=UPI0039A3D424
MKNMVLLILGTMLAALSITLFAMPNEIADGGFVGISLLLYFSLDIPPSLVVFISFIIITLISMKYLSRQVVIKTAIATPLLSLFTFLTEDLGQPLGDPLVGGIFFGLFMGSAFGLILHSGGSFGGSSTVALILKRIFGWDVVLVTFILDLIVVLSGVFIIGVLNTLYTIIALFVGKLATDYVLNGFNAKKAFQIISTQNEEIARRVTQDLSSSATYINGSGVYASQEQKILYVVVNNHRVIHLRKLINDIDSNAFIVVSNVKDVSGGTFFANQVFPVLSEGEADLEEMQHKGEPNH